VTVPATFTHLDSFTFYVDLPTNLIFRGEVYAWDNTCPCATGPAQYESGQTSTASYGAGYNIQPITFKTGGIPLTAGAQYVLFFTISKDYAANAGVTGTGFVAYVSTDPYLGGDWVYVSNSGDTSQWTNPLTRWTNTGFDLAFKASFS
jgi:hypothetical protein